MGILSSSEDEEEAVGCIDTVEPEAQAMENGLKDGNQDDNQDANQDGNQDINQDANEKDLDFIPLDLSDEESQESTNVSKVPALPETVDLLISDDDDDEDLIESEI